MCSLITHMGEVMTDESGVKKKDKPPTPKMLHFSRCLASGMSQAQSYREAYNTEGMADASIHTEACRLASDPRITARVNQIIAVRERHIASASSTIRDRAKVLEFLRLAMEADHASGSQLRSAELLGKAAGLFTDKLQVETNQSSSDDIASEILERLQQAVVVEESVTVIEPDGVTMIEPDTMPETKH